MRHGVAVALACVIALAFPTPSRAQWRSARTAPLWAQAVAREPTRPWHPTVLSLALPGAGQHVLGQRRKWAYLALEIAGWAVYLERRASGGHYRDRYRDFAWERGRIQSGPRVDGDFEYYERLSNWPSSGAFDADPGRSGVQPESDPGTYNGSIWLLASQIFLPPGPSIPETDPAYQSALAYYERRAYGTELLWDWTEAPEAQRELGRLIEISDDRFREATTAVGVVIANHLLSAGDAFLSSRGRTSPARLRVQPREGPGGGWLAVVSVGVGP
jgi:hypothetical protein